MNLLVEMIDQEVMDRIDNVAIEVDNQKKIKEGNDEFYVILNKLFELAPEHFNMLLDLESAVGNIRFHSVDLSYRYGMSDGIKISKNIQNSLVIKESH